MNTSKQIDQLDEITTAYIAGIIDGEGTIFVASLGGKRNNKLYPVVRIAMTYKPIIEWLEVTLGTCKHYVHIRKNPNPKAKKCFACTLYGKKAILLCSKLLPYLKVKHRQAELLLDFPINLYKGPGIKLDDVTIQRRKDIKTQLSNLNERGVKNG